MYEENILFKTRGTNKLLYGLQLSTEDRIRGVQELWLKDN